MKNFLNKIKLFFHTCSGTYYAEANCQGFKTSIFSGKITFPSKLRWVKCDTCGKEFVLLLTLEGWETVNKEYADHLVERGLKKIYNKE